MVIIDRALSGDFEHICELDEMVRSEPSRRGFIGRALAERRCAVARVDGAIRGYVIVGEFFSHAFIELLLVHPDFRRRGIGASLIRSAEIDAPTGKLFTSTNESNLPMQRLCERAGFVRSGMVENLDEGDPEIFYFKRLAPA